MLFKKPQYIALSVVVLLTITLLKLPTRATANFKRAVSGMFLPMHGLASSAEDLAIKTSYAALPRHALVQRIEELEREKQSNAIRLMQPYEVMNENARLRTQIIDSRH